MSVRMLPFVFCRPGSLPQVFLTSLPPVATQIPVSAVQLHPVINDSLLAVNLLLRLLTGVCVCPSDGDQSAEQQQQQPD